MNNEPKQLFPLQPSGAIVEAHYTRTPEEAGIRYDELRAAYKSLPSSVFEGEQLKPVYKVVSLDLTNATNDHEIGIVGNIFKFQFSTAATDRLNVRFGSSQNDQIPFTPGKGLNGMYFDRLLLSWAATPGSVAQIVIIYDPRDERTNAAG